MSNLFSVDEQDILHRLGDVVFHIASFMDPVEASVISKRCLQVAEKTCKDALHRIIQKMSGIILADDYMSRLSETALDHCRRILPDDDDDRRGRPNLPALLPQRLLLLVSRHIIVVTGAGTPGVNGVYTQDEFYRIYPQLQATNHYLRNAPMYTKKGMWKNATRRFVLCNVSNNWYISIAGPPGSLPETNSDIDFYSSPVTADCVHIPPRHGWVKADTPDGGQDPPPTLSYMHRYSKNKI
jgi:hypothetical protein